MLTRSYSAPDNSGDARESQGWANCVVGLDGDDAGFSTWGRGVHGDLVDICG